MALSPLEPGLVGHAEVEVTLQHTARAAGSGSVDVYATPWMVALMEAAAVDCVAPHLAPGETTVGTAIDVVHEAATPVGARIEATAELVAVEGRALAFRVEAHDQAGRIGHGRHTRLRIDRARFEAGLAARHKPGSP